VPQRLVDVEEEEKKKTVSKRKKDDDDDDKKVAKKAKVAPAKPAPKKAAPKAATTAKQATPKKPASKKAGAKKKKDESEDEESEEEEDESEDDGKKKKFKKGRKKPIAKTYSSALIVKLSQDKQDELKSLSLAELKERLKANDQVSSSSTKGELIGMIADFMTHGGLPRCPKCFGGKLKAAVDGSYFCPGFYDDEKFKVCYYKADTVDRVKWVPAENKLI